MRKGCWGCGCCTLGYLPTSSDLCLCVNLARVSLSYGRSLQNQVNCIEPYFTHCFDLFYYRFITILIPAQWYGPFDPIFVISQHFKNVTFFHGFMFYNGFQCMDLRMHQDDRLQQEANYLISDS